MSRSRGLYKRQDPVQDFKGYLSKAGVTGVLPQWWSEEKEVECIALGIDSPAWPDLNCKVQKADIIKHYGDGSTPMHLRMVAEMVEETNVSGQPAGQGLQSMVAMSEMQERNGMHSSTIDMSSRTRGL